jgi:long-chain acyl-CoA synthetase
VNPFFYLQRNAERDPLGVFTQSPAEIVTNEEAFVSAKKLAYELRRLGVEPGDVVALDLPDQLGMLFTEALFHEAATSTILPKGYVAEGVFTVDWIFSSGTPTPQPGARIVTVDSRFLREVEQNPYGISAREGAADIVRIVFSSGTTGTPNAIPFALESEDASEQVLGSLLQGDPFLMLFDASTAWGYTAFSLSVKHGLPFLSVGRAGQEAIVRLAVQKSVTSLKASPAQVAAFVAELDAQGRTLPSLQSVLLGGTVMPPGLAERMRRAAEGCRIIAVYGSTEAKMATVRDYDSDDPYDVGRILPESRVEIVDDHDRVLSAGQIGRVRQQHPRMVHRYLGNPEASARIFTNGWFYPGDLGFIRPDGGLTLAGRESEVLNAGGVKIDPTLLDLAASRNPKVRDACSFEYTTTEGLVQIGLALVAEDDLNVHALVRELTAEFGPAAPALVARVEEIPRNAMGKPMRQKLAADYRES